MGTYASSLRSSSGHAARIVPPRSDSLTLRTFPILLLTACSFRKRLSPLEAHSLEESRINVQVLYIVPQRSWQIFVSPQHYLTYYQRGSEQCSNYDPYKASPILHPRNANVSHAKVTVYRDQAANLVHLRVSQLSVATPVVEALMCTCQGVPM